MTPEEQIAKILELDQKISKKQNSILSAHSLMPVSLVVTALGFAFAIGMAWNSTTQTKQDLEDFKKDYKADQVDLKADLKEMKNSISDIRVLLVQYQDNINKR